MATTRNSRTSYNYGTAARNIDVRRAIEEAPTGRPLREIRGEQLRKKKMNMTVFQVLFLSVAMAVLGFAIVSYLRLQSEITNLVDNVSYYEAALNNLTLENDDEYSKIVESIDYNEIKRSAIEDLGMVYASEDQIIKYTRENSDYVRQLNDLSK